MSVYPLFYKRIYLMLYLKSNKVMFIQYFYANTKYLRFIYVIRFDHVFSILLNTLLFQLHTSPMVWVIGFEPMRLSEWIYSPPLSTAQPYSHCWWKVEPARDIPDLQSGAIGLSANLPYLVWVIGFEPMRLSDRFYRPLPSTTQPYSHYWCIK